MQGGLVRSPRVARLQHGCPGPGGKGSEDGDAGVGVAGGRGDVKGRESLVGLQRRPRGGGGVRGRLVVCRA